MTVTTRISREGYLQYLMATAPEIVDLVVQPKVVEKIMERPVYVGGGSYVRPQLTRESTGALLHLQIDVDRDRNGFALSRAERQEV